MEKQELKNKINQFCKSKNFENPFIQECITEFIERHTELYGDVIPAENLFERLENNLDKITFAGPIQSPNGELGEYKGRIADNTDINEVLIYFDETDLDLSETDKNLWNLYAEPDKQKLLQDMQEKKALIKSTLIHELTHSAYTIKDRYGMGEKHIFSTTGNNYFIPGNYYTLIGGNSNNVEAIVNYISNRIEGKNSNKILTYPAETKAIYMLAEKMDEKSIVKSAWVSDEQQFKQAYVKSISPDIEAGEKSYNVFQDIMKKLVFTRESKDISIGEYNKRNEQLLSEFQQILDGKKQELEFGKLKNWESTIKVENTISTGTPEEPNKLSFTQKIARFFEKNKTLMNIPIIKKFVRKQLDILPPAKNPDEKNVSTLNSKRDDFINELSNNGNFRKIQPLQTTNEKNPSLEETDKRINTDDGR